MEREYQVLERLAAVDMASTEIGLHQSTWRQAARLPAKLDPTNEERALVEWAFGHPQ